MNTRIMCVLVGALALAGCITTSAPHGELTDLRAQFNTIQRGLTAEQVLAALGAPGDRALSGNVEIWQYCQQGFVNYLYGRIRFEKGRVAEVTTATYGAYGVPRCWMNWPGIDFVDLEIGIS